MTIIYRIQEAHSNYLAGEDVILGLAIENTGSSVLRIPDPEMNSNWEPVYTIFGPGYPQGITVNLRAQTRGIDSHVPRPDQAVLLAIEPGKTWEGHVILSQLADLSKPGQYRFRSRFEWEGLRAETGEVTFAVEPLHINGVNIGLGLTRSGHPEIYVVGLHRGKKNGVLFQSRFSEVRPDLGEIARSGVVRLAETSIDASNPLSPNTNYSRFDDLFNWSAWLEGRTLFALPSTGGHSLRLELQVDPLTVITPVIMDNSHALDIFMLAQSQAGKAQLLLARFLDPSKSPSQSSELLWSYPLPVLPESSGVALEPAGGGDLRHVAFVSSENGHLNIFHASLKGSQPLLRFDSVELEKVRLIPNSPPALIVEKNGGARVALWVRSDSDERRLFLVESVFNSKLPPVAPRTIQSLDLPNAPLGARIGYFQKTNDTLRMDWVILANDGKLYAARPEGGTRLVRERINPGAPLVFLVLSQTSYLLTVGSEKGVFFDPL